MHHAHTHAHTHTHNSTTHFYKAFNTQTELVLTFPLQPEVCRQIERRLDLARHRGECLVGLDGNPTRFAVVRDFDCGHGCMVVEMGDRLIGLCVCVVCCFVLCERESEQWRNWTSHL